MPGFLSLRPSRLPSSLLYAFGALVFFYGYTDLLTTALDLRTGLGVEGNPLASLILAHYGLLGLIFLKLLALAFAYLLACLFNAYDSPRLLTVVFFVFAFLFALISFSNLFGFLTGYDLFHFLFLRLILFLLSLR